MFYTRAIVHGVANHTPTTALHLSFWNMPTPGKTQMVLRSLQRSVRTSSLWNWNATFFLSTKDVMLIFQKSKKQHTQAGKSWQVNLCTLKANPAILIHPFTTMRGCSLPFVNLCFQPFRLTGKAHRSLLDAAFSFLHHLSIILHATAHKKDEQLGSSPHYSICVTACSSRRGAKQLIRFSNGSMFIAAAFENQRSGILTWPARSSFRKGLAPALPEWSDSLLIF